MSDEMSGCLAVVDQLEQLMDCEDSKLYQSAPIMGAIADSVGNRVADLLDREDEMFEEEMDEILVLGIRTAALLERLTRIVQDGNDGEYKESWEDTYDG
ncbi:MAG: hypothetical protein VX063_03820 [SAR324 cluster bacterium]|nr:hypothetical protein [SAR324 cluster bacterium]